MLIGIDGGGTKTALVLAEENGRLLNTVKGLGSNPADIGLEECENRLRSELDELLRGFGGREATVDSVYAGIAGSANERTKAAVGEILRRLLPNARRVDNGSDAFNALYGEAEEGIALIAGTGSSAFVLTKDGSHQVGGWGYLVDDAGSGYSIGRAVLNAAFRERDGRGESTRLTELVERQLGFNVLGAVPMIYRGGKRTVASFAPLAFEAADMGDRQALAIVDNACRELRLLISTCASHLKKAPYLASLLGSLWKAPRLLEGVRDLLSPDYRLLRPDLPPVFGAAVAAAELARVSCGEAFHDRFAESYTTFTKKAEA